MKNQPHSRALSAVVVGAGRIAEEHLRFLCGSSQAKLAGVCDSSPTMATLGAERFGGSAFTDYRTMLKQVKPDVVHVLTPPHTHVALAGDALEIGAHVIVEKPITPSRTEFDRLWRRAEQHERLLIEDHNYRFNAPVCEIERLVREGVLGDVREVEVRMALGIRSAGGRYADENLPHPSHRLPAGVLHEFLTHLCYLALRFVGSPSKAADPEFERVRAAWSNHGGGDLFKYDDLDAIVVVSPVHLRIRFDAHSRPECLELVVRGTRGTARTDLFQPHVLLNIPRSGPDQLTPVINQRLAGRELKRAARRNLVNKVMQKTPYEGLQTFLDLTYRSLLDNTEPPVTHDDMARTIDLIEALLDEANRI